MKNPCRPSWVSWLQVKKTTDRFLLGFGHGLHNLRQLIAASCRGAPLTHMPNWTPRGTQTPQRPGQLAVATYTDLDTDTSGILAIGVLSKVSWKAELMLRKREACAQAAGQCQGGPAFYHLLVNIW